MRSKTNGINVFLVPTANPRYIQFYIDIGKAGVSDFNSCLKLREGVDTLFKDLEKVEITAEHRDLWVPCFKYQMVDQQGPSLVGNIDNPPDVNLVLIRC